MDHLFLRANRGKGLTCKKENFLRASKIMIYANKPNRNTWLWWIAAIALSIGIAVFVLLKPAEYDVEVQRIRSLALVVSFMISGLCIIIGTSRRWFGKDL